MRLYPETKIAIGLIVTFMLVVTSTTLTYINSDRAIESGKSVSTGLELLAALESFFLTLRTIEQESLKYAQTGESQSLNRFRKAEKTLDAHIEFIKQLGAMDVRRYVQITSMETKARSIVNLASELVRQRQRSAVNLVPPSSYLETQQTALDLIRSRIIYMESEEKEIIKRHNSVYESETKRLFQTYAVLGVFTVVFFFGLVFLLLRYIQSERRIAATEKRVATEIVSHAPIGVMILDETLRIVSVNPTFLVYLHLDVAPVGKTVFDVLPNLPHEVEQKLFQLNPEASPAKPPPAEAGDLIHTIELKQHMVFPECYWDLVMWPMIYEEAFRGLIILASDVSEKVVANHQRQLLLNTLTHDLKNPLIGNQYVLRALLTKSNKNFTAVQREGLEQLERGNEDILKMIKNILEISKLSEGITPINFREFNLKQLLETCVDDLSQLSQEKKVGLKCQFEPGEIEIESDDMAVKHIALNLLENAVKFSEEGAEVSLKLESSNGTVTFSVHDSGPGIPLEDQDKLFTTIWQGEAGRREVGGSGVGMYLCNQLVQLLGGSLRCESSAAGASFYVALPRNKCRN